MKILNVVFRAVKPCSVASDFKEVSEQTAAYMFMHL